MSPSAADRERRLDFLRRCLHAAAVLESDCLSCWSGILREEIDEDAAFDRLAPGLEPLLTEAANCGIPIGFEPEPGMFIDTLARYEQLTQRITSPLFKLTLDVGHLHCQREEPIPELIVRWQSRIVNVHLEDMRVGVHEHLMFGEGEIDFFEILAAFTAINYRGGVHVELSRHSHLGPQAAKQSLEFLQPLVAALRIMRP
jgi:sugar phosphate isomerase/epimerase